ncbi:GlyGly-CTERM sorting domain-containing protein [Saccharopolyspora halophila]|uniref:GlyGly-CTERM sorting domain-containing protein n=1 Tax=Saccharopolyspora halophila TaxID=405551 RepID=UPI003CD05586
MHTLVSVKNPTRSGCCSYPVSPAGSGSGPMGWFTLIPLPVAGGRRARCRSARRCPRVRGTR